jgi:hypothetical protein
LPKEAHSSGLVFIKSTLATFVIHQVDYGQNAPKSLSFISQPLVFENTDVQLLAPGELVFVQTALTIAFARCHISAIFMFTYRILQMNVGRFLGDDMTAF